MKQPRKGHITFSISILSSTLIAIGKTSKLTLQTGTCSSFLKENYVMGNPCVALHAFGQAELF
jgi:hypothetical protein